MPGVEVVSAEYACVIAAYPADVVLLRVRWVA